MNHFGNAGQFLIGTVFGLALVVLLLRVLLQAVAILVLVGAVWWRHNAGG